MYTVGIDFDNTIINYSDIYQDIAKSLGANPSNIINKNDFKLFLHQKYKSNSYWTQQQGITYGKKIGLGTAHAGFSQFVSFSKEQNFKIFIVSHKTKYPAYGENIHLREQAIDWLKSNESRIQRSDIFFANSLDEKVDIIKQLNCNIFVDDLLQVLTHHKFPQTTQPVLFQVNPNQNKVIHQVSSFYELLALFKRNVFIECKKNTYKPNPQIKLIYSKSIKNSTLTGATTQGGINNTVQILKDKNDFYYIQKEYRTEKQFPNPRQIREQSFLKHLNAIQLTTATPKVLNVDLDQGISSFSYIQGTLPKLNANFSEQIWKQCLNFLIEIQQPSPNKACIPNAKESAFSLREHLEILTIRRNDWLEKLLKKELDCPNLNKFFLELYEPVYQKVAQIVLDHPYFNTPIKNEFRIINPSDFGLHNALFNKNNELLAFIDFEYAGWDDPAKMISDFFAQPRYPAPKELMNKFIQSISLSLFPQGSSALEERFPYVYSMIQMKWCLIRLGRFYLKSNQRADSTVFEDITHRISHIKNTLNIA
mgnify:CR=1 FL=1